MISAVFVDRPRLAIVIAFVITIVVGIGIGVFIDVFAIAPLGGFSARENTGWLVMALSLVLLIVFWFVVPVTALQILCALGFAVGFGLEVLRTPAAAKFDPNKNLGWIISTFALGVTFMPAIISASIATGPQRIPDLIPGTLVTIGGVPITYGDLLLVVAGRVLPQVLQPGQRRHLVRGHHVEVGDPPAPAGCVRQRLGEPPDVIGLASRRDQVHARLHQAAPVGHAGLVVGELPVQRPQVGQAELGELLLRLRRRRGQPGLLARRATVGGRRGVQGNVPAGVPSRCCRAANHVDPSSS